MDKPTSTKYGHYGYTSWSVGNQIDAARNSSSSGDATLKSICDICHRPRGKNYNHEQCSKIRQAKYAKEKA